MSEAPSRALFTHARLALFYSIGAAVLGLVATFLAMGVRAQRTWPGHGLLRSDAYLEWVTLHAGIFLYGCIVPMLLQAGPLAFVSHRSRGEPSVASGLQRIAFGLFFVGGVSIVGALFVAGGPLAGWEGTPPLSTEGVPDGALGSALWDAARVLFAFSLGLSSCDGLERRANPRPGAERRTRSPSYRGLHARARTSPKPWSV